MYSTNIIQITGLGNRITSTEARDEELALQEVFTIQRQKGERESCWWWADDDITQLNLLFDLQLAIASDHSCVNNKNGLTLTILKLLQSFVSNIKNKNPSLFKQKGGEEQGSSVKQSLKLK